MMCDSKLPEEKDPHGISPHEAGAKLDNGKPRPGLVLGDFSRALSAVTAVGTFGANKYTDHGWLSVIDGENRYEDARMRHWAKRHAGESVDPESKISHLAHEAWNVLAQLELAIRREEKERIAIRREVPSHFPV